MIHTLIIFAEDCVYSQKSIVGYFWLNELRIKILDQIQG